MALDQPESRIFMWGLIINNFSSCHQVSFGVTIDVKECPKEGQTNRTLNIYPVGLTEKLVIELDLICQCDCELEGALVGTLNARRFACSYWKHPWPKNDVSGRPIFPRKYYSNLGWCRCERHKKKFGRFLEKTAICTCTIAETWFDLIWYFQNIRMRFLKTEVEKGSMWTALCFLFSLKVFVNL